MSKNWKVIREKEADGKYVVTIGITQSESITLQNDLIIAAGEWMQAHRKRFYTAHVRFRGTTGTRETIVLFGTWRVTCDTCNCKAESSARFTECVRTECDGVMSA